VKRPYARRCGASAPNQDAEKDWHYCYHPAGHAGKHEDDERIWSDGEMVRVTVVEEMYAVPHHVHDFVGDEDRCVRIPECNLTYGGFRAQKKAWEEEQADTCSHCGHAEHCHTTSLPEEGYRDYCTECQGADEFHAMDEEPKTLPVTRERLLEVVRGLLPGAPQERLEAAVDRMRVMLALADPEPAREPEKAMTARLEGVRAPLVQYDEVAVTQHDERGDTDPEDDECWCGHPRRHHRDKAPNRDACCETCGATMAHGWSHAFKADDEDLAVECECGTVWPDGVLGKGHNDMACEIEPEIPQAPQNDMDDDVCFCGCTRKEHRSSPEWGESCDGCTRKGPRATYQWRHPFSRDVGRIKR
jgi:hypothetical protein